MMFSLGSLEVPSELLSPDVPSRRQKTVFKCVLCRGSVFCTSHKDAMSEESSALSVENEDQNMHPMGIFFLRCLTHFLKMGMQLGDVINMLQMCSSLQYKF